MGQIGNATRACELTEVGTSAANSARDKPVHNRVVDHAVAFEGAAKPERFGAKQLHGPPRSNACLDPKA